MANLGFSIVAGGLPRVPASLYNIIKAPTLGLAVKVQTVPETMITAKKRMRSHRARQGSAACWAANDSPASGQPHDVSCAPPIL